MSTYALSHDLWLLSEQSDRRFRRLLLAFALPALVAGIVIPLVQMAGLQQGGGELLPARYAKLLAPAQPETEQPKPVEKPVAKPKPQLTQEQKVAKARAKASKLMSSFDQLSELRDLDLPVTDQKLTTNVITSRSGTPSTFASSADKTSGGIGEVGVVRRQDSTTGLGERRTTTVKSPVGAGREAEQGQSGDRTKAGRTFEEIQLVFDRNKGAFYTMYAREQRARPEMQGKVVVRMTIAPSGVVTRCTVISSELNHPEFERKVVSRVLLLNFGAKDVGDFTIDYPIYFLPS